MHPEGTAVNSNDKEYLLSVLDEVVTTLAVVPDGIGVNPNIYNRISRAMMLIEKSIMENDSGGPYVDPSQGGLDFHPWQDQVYDEDKEDSEDE